MAGSRRSRRHGPAIEGLEERQYLSAIGRWLDSAVDSLSDRAKEAVVHLQETVAPKKSPAVVILGDGLSDEYGGQFPARNWAELLAASGRVNLGAYSASPREDGRGTGFALNWAAPGASTADLIDRQLPGAVEQVATGNVKAVVVMAGMSDFVDFLENEAPKYKGRPGEFQKRLDEVRRDAKRNLSRVVGELQRANEDVTVVVATVPDFTRLPGYESAWKSQGARGELVASAVRRSMQSLNNELRAWARGQDRLTVADLARQLDPRLRGTGLMRMGPETIDLASLGDDYHQFLLQDGRHLGTVGQALMANGIVNAMNSQFRVKLRPMGSAEIIAMAALAQGSRT